MGHVRSRERYLVKTMFDRERNTDLTNVSGDSRIRSVIVKIPLETTVYGCGRRRQWTTNGETATAKRHVIPVHHVLLDALRASADVPHLLVIVLGENLHEIICEEDGVVISHHKPSYIWQIQPDLRF